MIPAYQPYEANYKHQSGDYTYLSDKPVIAWDDDGNALVVDEKAGKLRAANSYANFDSVTPVAAPVIAAIPAHGWIAEFKDDSGGTFKSPLVAWAVRADGTLEPVHVDSDGLSDDPTAVGNFIRLRGLADDDGRDDEQPDSDTD